MSSKTTNQSSQYNISPAIKILCDYANPTTHTYIPEDLIIDKDFKVELMYGSNVTERLSNCENELFPLEEEVTDDAASSLLTPQCISKEADNEKDLTNN